MNITDENNRQIQLLKEVIAKGELFTIVGTGVSRLATNQQKVNDEVVTSWPGLLSHGIKFCTPSNGELPAKIAAASHYLNAFRAVNDVDDLLKAASQIRKHLNEQAEAAMVSWLDAALGGLEPSEPQIIQALHQLPGFLATLNYDHLIEKVTQRKTLTLRDTGTIAALRRKENDERQFVIHIHGSYTIPKTCVLDVESYEEILRDRGTQTALQFFSAGHNLLFVGCGGTFTDPNFSRLIQWGNDVFTTLSDLKHFVLCPETELEVLGGQLLDLKCYWLKPLVYGQKHEDLTAFLRQLNPAPTPPPGLPIAALDLTPPTSIPTSKPTPRSIAYYLDWLAADTQYITMLGMGPGVQLELPITSAYVPLHMMRPIRHDQETAERLRDLDLSQRDVDLTEVFRECRRLDYRAAILLGEPGAGKTTGARRLAHQLATGADLGLPPGQRPVLLRFRNLQPTTIADQPAGLAGLRAFLNQETYRSGAPDGYQNPGDDLWNDEPGLIWILDGLDEVVDPKLRTIVAGWLSEVTRERQKDFFLVTSRFQGFNDLEKTLGLSFLKFHVQNLSDQDVDLFIRQWFQAVHERLLGRGDEAQRKARDDGDELLQKLGKLADYQSRRMREVMRNPLLLTILCRVFFEERNLPDERVKLYEKCVHILLENWRYDLYEKPVNQAAVRRYDKESAQIVLARLAWFLHQKDKRTSAPLADLEREATAALAELSAASSQLGLDGGEFIVRMRKEAGLLAMSGSGNGDCGFLHQTFQEFLAADHAARNDELATIARGLTDTTNDWWREVCLLSLRLIKSAKFAERFFEQTIAQGIVETQPDLMERCLAESRHFAAEPFLKVLRDQKAAPRLTAAVLRLLMKYLPQVPGLSDICQPHLQSQDAEVRGFAQEIMQRLKPAVVEVIGSTRSRGPVTVASKPEALRFDDRTGQTLIWLPPGTFRMGSERYDWEKPVRDVQLTRGFYLGKYPVTNEQYGRFLEAAPGKVQTPKYWDDRRFNQPEQPVVGVSWQDAASYCAWAGGRLPTEVEWEYACRAGSTGEYCFGNDESQLGEFAWYDKNSGGQTQPVGGKKANAWGLHDMHGNVWEWCVDRFEFYDPRELIDPDGPSKGSFRVYRGGSWNNAVARCRSAYRSWTDPTIRWSYLGFRLALSPSGASRPAERGSR